MDKKLEKRIAYCGLICELDSCFSSCEGCKEPDANCGDKDCFHKKCCISKKLNGCWECELAPCDDGYFSGSNSSNGQFIAFIKYIKVSGLNAYMDKIKSNMEDGLRYGIDGDYGDKAEKEVLELMNR